VCPRKRQCYTGRVRDAVEKAVQNSHVLF
jgi:hypothetical protein